MLDKTRIGKKWQDSILELVDKLVITSRGIYMEASELIGESPALHSVLADCRKDNERLSTDVGVLREQISSLQVMPESSHPPSAAGSCNCKSQLEPIAIELSAAVKVLKEATGNKLAKDTKRRQKIEFQLGTLTPDNVVAVSQ